ncbi:MAG: tRNA(His) guanylyltransferase Thg1 family protein, partial [Clostridia bacterium]|nr:tRNA(His) guanylyltransferase Thg1 family protein [Clostridia bacterium]
MPVNDELGLRMKNFYENISKTKLIRRTPVAIRIDGKAFHTFTRGFQKPFDEVLMKTMQETMKYLCENIQGCVLGYTQSDEITLILVDYQKLDTSAWFDYEVQKLCSISASMATMAFNKFFYNNIDDYFNKDNILEIIYDKDNPKRNDVLKYAETLQKALRKGAMFDSRCFNIPKEEVANLLYWRQLDATRNSIQMVGQANFSHKELNEKSCNDIQDMLMLQKGINWNDFPVEQKRGSCCIKKAISDDRTAWVIDTNIPIFKGENRQYI